MRLAQLQIGTRFVRKTDEYRRVQDTDAMIVYVRAQVCAYYTVPEGYYPVFDEGRSVLVMFEDEEVALLA